jgi:O-antigen/teichoic acid export membrane protein
VSLFRNTLVYVVVGFLPVAANFLLAPVYTRYLIPEEYALVGISTLLQTFLTFFISLSLDAAFTRQYFNYEHKSFLKHALMSTLLISVFMLCLVNFLILFIAGNRFFSLLFSNPNFRFTNFGYWVVINTYTSVVFLLFAALYRNEEKIKKFVILSLCFFFIPVAGSLFGLVYLKNGALGTVAGKAIGSVLVTVAALIVYYWKKKIIYMPRLFLNAVKYSLPLVPYQLMFAGFMNIDRIILERMFTARDFGIYNFAIMISGLIPIFINSISNAVNPRIYRELSFNEDPDIVRTFNQICLFGTTLIICLCVAAVVPAMQIFISHKYADAYLYVGTLFLSYLPYMHYLINTLPLFYYGKTKVFPVISFFSLMTGIAFNYAFIPYFGIWAVCLSLYVIRLTQMGISYLFVKKHKLQAYNFLKQKKELVLSLFIILVYNVLLSLDIKFRFVPISIINTVPLLLFVVPAISVYRKSLKISLGYLRQLGKMMRSSTVQ